MPSDAELAEFGRLFQEFLQVSLERAGRAEVGQTEKVGFCLASTDAIDLTVPHARWRPPVTSLQAACGSFTSLGIREVLEIGSGDTSTPQVAGQAFDVTDLPNGTYYIEIAANPDGVLVESDPRNNVAVRTVQLGGEPGARTVTVPPFEAVDG